MFLQTIEKNELGHICENSERRLNICVLNTVSLITYKSESACLGMKVRGWTRTGRRALEER